VVKIAYVSVDKDLNFANAWIQKAKVSLQAIQLTLTPAVETTRERGVAAGGPQMLATSNVCGVDAAVRHVLCCVIAKFHYTDPTGPGSPTKSAHVVGYSSYTTTCADFVGDPGPVGSV